MRKIFKGTFAWAPALGELCVREWATITVEDGVIEGVYGSAEEVPEAFRGPDVTVKDFGDRLVIPAFADIHVHAPQYTMRGVGLDKELLPWLQEHTFPAEGRFADPVFARRAYELFLNRLWEEGTLAFCAFATVHADATWALMDMAERAGFSGLVGKVEMDRNAPDYLTFPAGKLLKDTEGLIVRSRRELSHMRYVATPRFVPSTTPELMDGLAELVERYDLPVQSHVDENRSEIAWVRELEPASASYAAAYADHGLMPRGKTVLAHAVWITDEELDLIRERGVTLAHCPQSNANLSSGVMRVRRALSHGAEVAVASDVAGGHEVSQARHAVAAIQASKLVSIERPQERAIALTDAFHLVTAAPGAFLARCGCERTGAFEPGCAFTALVIGPDDLDALLPATSAEERLARFFYTGDSRSIEARYVRGAVMEKPIVTDQKTT